MYRVFVGRETPSSPPLFCNPISPLNPPTQNQNPNHTKHTPTVQNLSGGELQRVAIVLCLGKPADVYLIDEPSAYLDSEQRIACSKVIKRFIMHSKKTAFVVEHDFIIATYLADR
jgi:translation initiation factor RLI1